MTSDAARPLAFRFLSIAVAACMIAASGTPAFALPALAQTAPATGSDGSVPATAPTAPAAPAVGAPAATTQPAPRKVQLSLAALFADKGAPIRSGLHWRVFGVRNDQSGDVPLVGESRDGAPTFALEPGVYVVHAAYGLAAATLRVEMGGAPAVETMVLNCGALKAEGSIGDRPLPASSLTLRISVLMPTGERRLIADAVPADPPTRLPAGRYFVESTYGGSNATVSAEIAIKPGQLTDAVFHHNAATLTLKLVNQPGGEALADTAWSVLTPGGDVIRESIGAFPTMILAEGNYTVVARHDGHVYTREFDVKAGEDQDVEVMSK